MLATEAKKKTDENYSLEVAIAEIESRIPKLAENGIYSVSYRRPCPDLKGIRDYFVSRGYVVKDKPHHERGIYLSIEWSNPC